MKKYKLLICLLILIIPTITYAKSTLNTVNIYFFHSNTCPHCQEEKKILKEIKKEYENIKIHYYEINDEKNQIILNEVKKAYNIKTNGVPITIIGNKVYTGYIEEKSPKKFIKTINYFSKYDYDDKVMKIINPNYISTYHESPYIKRPPLKDFIKTYKNYKLLGLETDNLLPSTITMILGLLSEINIINLLSIIILLLILKNIGGLKNKMLLVFFYFIINNILRISLIIKNDYLTLIIYIAMMILFLIGLLGYTKNKKRQYVGMNIILVLSIITEYLNNYFYEKYPIILNDIAKLNVLRGLNYYTYYLEYFVSIILIDAIIIIVIYLIFEKKLRNI